MKGDYSLSYKFLSKPLYYRQFILVCGILKENLPFLECGLCESQHVCKDDFSLGFVTGIGYGFYETIHRMS